MARKRVFIIQGWAGRNNQDWLPWAKTELDKLGYETNLPAMPNPDHPNMTEWLNELRKIVRTPRNSDIFIGHSMGCQAILRFLEGKNKNVNIVILVAPWMVLSQQAYDIPEDHDIANPWLNNPIDFKKIKTLANKFICIFSDNDPWVPLKLNKDVFESKLNADVIIEHDKGHFMKNLGNVSSLPILLKFV